MADFNLGSIYYFKHKIPRNSILVGHFYRAKRINLINLGKTSKATMPTDDGIGPIKLGKSEDLSCKAANFDLLPCKMGDGALGRRNSVSSILLFLACLYYLISYGSNMKLTFKPPTATSTEMDVSPEWTVAELKEKLSPLVDIPADQLRLVSSGGKVFAPEHAEVSALNLRENDFVYVHRTSAPRSSDQSNIPVSTANSAQSSVVPPEMSQMLNNPFMEY